MSLLEELGEKAFRKRRFAAGETTTKAAPRDDGDPLWPTKSTDTSRGNQYSPSHPARDIVGSTGDPIVSSVAGRIVGPIIRDPAYGLNVSVLAESGPLAGYTFHYSHLSGIVEDLAIGAKVKAGEYLGMVGSTGRSTGPHLDFEVYNPQGSRIDPLSVDWGNFAAPSSIPKLSEHQTVGTARKRGRSAASSYDVPDKPEREIRTYKTPFGDVKVAMKPEPDGEQGAVSKALGGIPIMSTPFGPLTLSNPGARFKQFVGFGIGALVFLIALFVMIGRSRGGKKARQVGRVAAVEGASMIPVVGEVISVGKVAKAAS